MKQMFARFAREEAGQDLIEYALLAGLIALVAIAGVTLVGTAVGAKFSAASTSVTNAGS
jgi:pilus assembly protein Flp/PilA